MEFRFSYLLIAVNLSPVYAIPPGPQGALSVAGETLRTGLGFIRPSI
jgi:hypothetical protein